MIFLVHFSCRLTSPRQSSNRKTGYLLENHRKNHKAVFGKKIGVRLFVLSSRGWNVRLELEKSWLTDEWSISDFRYPYRRRQIHKLPFITPWDSRSRVWIYFLLMSSFAIKANSAFVSIRQGIVQWTRLRATSLKYLKITNSSHPAFLRFDSWEQKQVNAYGTILRRCTRAQFFSLYRPDCEYSRTGPPLTLRTCSALWETILIHLVT